VQQESENIVAQRLQTALELFETGVDMMRQTLIRRHPEDSRDKIEQHLNEWIVHRPGAEHGDCNGRPRLSADRIAGTRSISTGHQPDADS